MSTSLASKPLTIAQRQSAAAEHAAKHLHIDDSKRLLAALAEIAAEELDRNPGFALRVRGRYEELAPSASRRAPGANSVRAAKPEAARSQFAPIKIIEDHEINVARALDPYFLLDLYGSHQLRAVLEDQTRDNLREAVQIVKEQHPKTRPAGGSTQAMIEYIMQYVVGTK